MRVLWLRREGVLDARFDESGPLWGFNAQTFATGVVLLIGGLFVLRRGLRSSEVSRDDTEGKQMGI